MMLPILGSIWVVETVLYVLLVSKVPPLEKLSGMLLDLTHTTRGSAATKTLGVTFLIFLASSVSTYASTKSNLYSTHGPDMHSHVAPAEYFILRTAELESALTAFILLEAWMINRVHYYLRGKRGLTVQLEILKKQSKQAEIEYMRLQDEGKEPAGVSEVPGSSLKEVVEELKRKVESLQRDNESKDKDKKNAEQSAQAIRKQSEGMALEYERLLGDNDTLRDQLAEFDRQHSRSAGKKDT